MSDNLPGVPFQLSSTFTGTITVDDDIEKVKEKDLEIIHGCMGAIYEKLASNPIMSIDSICKCALTIAKLQEYRRRLLLLPYAANTAGSESGKVLPLDRD